MLCLSGFELYSRWVPLNYADILRLGIYRVNELSLGCVISNYVKTFQQ